MAPPSLTSETLVMEHLPKLTAAAFTLLYRTCRIEILGRRYHNQIMKRTQSVLLSAWHFAFPAAVCYFRHQGGLVMVSRSRDGEFAAKTLHQLGYLTVRGSSHRGGSKALREMLGLIRKGHSGGFVADGSQGPPEIAQKGILLLARYAQAPVMPLSVAARPCVRLPSWDRTLLPLPFARIALAFGPPIWVPTTTDSEGLERKREQLEAELKDLGRKAQAALAEKRPLKCDT
jgi:lysophospholipid acyltransferase (LPLAT)-like uncharacterized protein